MINEKTFESFYEGYDPEKLNFCLHMDKIAYAKTSSPIQALRLAVFEIDGAFLVIRTDVWSDFARQEIDIFQTLEEALECLDKAEDEYAKE